MPRHFREIAPQPGDVGGVAGGVEPLEHDAHVFILRLHGLDGEALVADGPAQRRREHSSRLLAGQFVACDVETLAEDGLAPLDKRSGKRADVGHGDLLQGTRGRHRHRERAGFRVQTHPWLQEIIHEKDRRADGERHTGGADGLLDGVLAVEVREDIMWYEKYAFPS